MNHMNANPYRVYDRGEEIKIGRSSSNPGELRFDIPDMAALHRAAAVFSDLTEQNVKRILRTGGLDDPDAWPVTDSFRYQQLHGGEQETDEDRWDAWVWWENERSGVSMEMERKWTLGRGETKDKWKVDVRIELRDIMTPWEERRALEWTHTFIIKTFRAFRRLNAKSYFIRALQLYLNSLVECP